ncbi:flagellar biosynthesis protein FlhF [Heyndrickxia shackletonii]|uniref:Flagellar biosynthesis protein FlhF n=1 Tax=Heyndrickxia shackletonii TaxID=157838 RepID=A0A0Q3TLP6_9BACI|nr:flagellar biosynthesis protein FlhF [Heyndrickxia shackletonii]KQL54617.1 flagellar biosynthesis protein FlhF [Heyndrickxia shackletonii]NEY98262.1 flagellar biosynthesis protein FlhF [Heyndrickxia shackletonii]
MKVKKYVAANMTEAMKQVRAELGEEAVILNSKVAYTGGFIGLFRKKQFEIIAAIDPQAPHSQVKLKEKQINVPTNAGVKDIEKLNNNGIQKELHDLKKMVEVLSSNSKAVTFDHYPLPIQKFLVFMDNQGISNKYIQLCADQLLKKWRTSAEEPMESEVFKWGKQYFEEVFAPFYSKALAKSKKYINLVGPTGVGKTTTLAKMAANAVIDRQKKVAFITTDTYRIAAIEQLKTYANLLQVPVEVVYNLSDFEQALEKFKDFDMIFIDTAGRNYRELQYIEELKKVIDFSKEMETLLTLSLTMKEEDIRAIIDSFGSIKIDHLIFTKLDETTTYGSILNIMLDYQIGTAYLTYGQDVPDDIQAATPACLVKHVFEGKS